MKPKIRLMVVDDHEVVRLGLSAIFRQTSGIEVVAEAGSVADAVKGAAQQISDLAAYVASLNLPSGLINSLESKLNSALQDPIPGSCTDLGNFVNQVSAQSGKAIPQSQAATLTQSAMRIKAVLGCR